MKNTIRCCISCILPCGALDVIRIVHSNGRVEEISGTIRAADIMRAHPKHILKKPSSSTNDDVKIVVVSPDAELQRGKIYFLMPAPQPDAAAKKPRHRSSSTKKRPQLRQQTNYNNANTSTSTPTSNTSNLNLNVNLLLSDHYLSEILSDKLSAHRDRRRGRSAIWRPHLQSISESPTHS